VKETAAEIETYSEKILEVMLSITDDVVQGIRHAYGVAVALTVTKAVVTCYHRNFASLQYILQFLYKSLL